MSDDTKIGGWGTELGRALAVLIPALLAALGGYIAGDRSIEAPPIDSIITPAPQPQENESTTVSELQKKLETTVAELEGLRAKIETLPSDASITIADFVTGDSITQAKCAESLESSFSTASIGYDKYGDSLFQVKNAKMGAYLFCNANGNVTFFVIADDYDAANSKLAVLKSALKKTFDN